MPMLPTIGAKVDARLVTYARRRSTNDRQYLRVSGADGDIQDHQCIEYAPLLRPGTSAIVADKEAKVRAQIDNSWFTSESYSMKMCFGIGERLSCNGRVGVIELV